MTDWTRVQGVLNTTGTGTSNTATFGAAVTSGNIVLVALFVANGVAGGYLGTTQTVTDDKGNVYRQIIDDGGNAGGTSAGMLVFYRSLHLITNAPTTITATVTISATVFWVQLAEFKPPTGATDISLSGYQYMIFDTGAILPNFQVLDNDVLVWGVSYSTGTSTTGTGFTTGSGSGTQQSEQWTIQATPTNTMSVFWNTQTGTAWAGAIAIAPLPVSRWEPIQHVINRTTTSSTTCVLSFANAVSAGSIVVGSIACDNNGLTHLTSLQDDKGNNYTLISGTLNAGQGTGDRQTWWSNGFIANGPKTVTATYNATQAVNFLIMDEFAPPPGVTVVAIDGTPVNTFNNTAQTSVTTPNVTTSKPGDLAYGWGDNVGSLDKPGNSFCATNGQSLTWMTAYYITGSSGTYNFVCNCGSGAVDGSLVIFDAFTPAATASRSLFVCRQQ